MVSNTDIAGFFFDSVSLLYTRILNIFDNWVLVASLRGSNFIRVDVKIKEKKS
jgi:hypothetical protein